MAGVVALATTAMAAPAAAFCGFYVAGAETDLFADATMVVMMREGTTTVLSMQNDYRGPVEDFAMVVPVPVVLSEENVKTLDKEVFDRVDQLAAPRLVEYWEQDPCPEPLPEQGGIGLGNIGTIGHGGGGGGGSGYGGRQLQVQVEAEFAVGEYEIVILSAQDSGDLDTWLRQNGYSIPEGAGAALAPYVQSGMKFFVAKVDIEKVTFEDGRALLSPLRVHYQSEEFSLPIRLGMLNSSGTQDLIVHVLGRNARYEAASYENVNVPTNLEVDDAVRNDFGGFYAALFDKTLEEHEGAVVTEYAWQATNCDPCPGPVLSDQDILTLGADVTGVSPETDDGNSQSLAWTSQVRPSQPEVTGGYAPEIVRRIMRRHVNEIRFCHTSRLAGTPAAAATLTPTLRFQILPSGATSAVAVTDLAHDGLKTCMEDAAKRWTFPAPDGDETHVTVRYNLAATTRSARSGLGFGARSPYQDFVLTRLHYRYGRGELGDDLVMRPAPPIVGGRGVGPANELPIEASASTSNNFQGRYIIRHPWEGEIECEEPVRGVWGRPPPGVDLEGANRRTVSATNLGTQPRGSVQLAALLKQPLPALGLSQVGSGSPPTQGQAPEAEAPSEAAAQSGTGGCGDCAAAGGPVELPLSAILISGWAVSLRRRR